MATNKHAIIRYRTIDRCLRDLDRQWTWKELAHACSEELQSVTQQETTISERTIKYDIAAMRSDERLGYHAPIEYDRKEKSYYYTDPSYRLTESAINKTDTILLSDTISMIEQFMQVTKATGINEILTKLESSLDRRKVRHTSIIQWDHDAEAPGQEWLYILYQKIKEKQAVTLTYAAFGKDKSDRIISPQLLKEYKGRWYLLSHDHTVEDSRVYALDRIQDIKESISEYRLLAKADARRYFDQVVGVSVLADKKVEKVRLEVYGIQLNYFKNKPLHASQTIIKESKDKAIIQIEVIINYELIAELLSYGKNIKILSPRSLKKEIRSIIATISDLYS